MWWDEHMLCLCSMSWQIGLTMVSAEEFTQIKFRNKSTLGRADGVLVMCLGQHYIPACKYSLFVPPDACILQPDGCSMHPDGCILPLDRCIIILSHCVWTVAYCHQTGVQCNWTDVFCHWTDILLFILVSPIFNIFSSMSNWWGWHQWQHHNSHPQPYSWLHNPGVRLWCYGRRSGYLQDPWFLWIFSTQAISWDAAACSFCSNSCPTIFHFHSKSIYPWSSHHSHAAHAWWVSKVPKAT